MEGNIALKLENITKYIGKKKVIDNVSFEIKQGEIFGLLGPNGAGKTTIMRMVTGLIKQTEGKITINGIDLSKNHDDALANIGAIIESPDLYKHLSGSINLKIMANMSRGVTKEKIKEVVEFVGLEKRIGEKVSKYSLGMRQRLGIAASLISSPKVLVLDEPLNGLDPDGVKEMRETFIKLAREHQVCIIISSHILSEMELVCDRFAIIDQGVLIETKDIGETNADHVMPYQVDLFERVDKDQLQTIVDSIGLQVDDCSELNFTVMAERKQMAELISELVKSDIKIVSSVPKKKSLEDYFIKRVSEIK
ncbi:MAG: bacitracin transporter ATP-binding protein [Bacillales bacterium]|nr:bacitracin transporter ATP-binding protein [Bacillales bacterium]